MNTTSKSTPGPWQVYKDQILGRVIKYFVVYSKTGEQPIVIGDVSNEADARLIAAAPELLEACEAALGLADAMSEGDLYDQLKAAIAKAKGEAQP